MASTDTKRRVTRRPPWRAVGDKRPKVVTVASGHVHEVRACRPESVDEHLPEWESSLSNGAIRSLSQHIGWLSVLRDGLKHEPYCVEARRHGRIVGLLPLALVRSVFFGRYLVSLPYLNSAGVQIVDSEAATVLIDRAVQLADELNVRYLELRHETEIDHPALTEKATRKVHMRLRLPDTSDGLWHAFKSKLRSQIRSGGKRDFEVRWGGHGLLDDFYAVFSHNMRDLGTPVYGKRLFRSVLRCFPQDAEFCVVHLDAKPVAAALLLHGHGVTEVPSASSLRAFNRTNANMFMYWQLLQRAIERGQAVFDFGRSTMDCGTYRFKKQWAAQPEPAVWQYYVRKGDVGEMRPENGKYRLAIRLWQRLPVSVTRLIGPPIVRGIP